MHLWWLLYQQLLCRFNRRLPVHSPYLIVDCNAMTYYVMWQNKRRCIDCIYVSRLHVFSIQRNKRYLLSLPGWAWHGWSQCVVSDVFSGHHPTQRSRDPGDPRYSGASGATPANSSDPDTARGAGRGEWHRFELNGRRVVDVSPTMCATRCLCLSICLCFSSLFQLGQLCYHVFLDLGKS